MNSSASREKISRIAVISALIDNFQLFLKQAHEFVNHESPKLRKLDSTRYDAAQLIYSPWPGLTFASDEEADQPLSQLHSDRADSTILVFLRSGR
ncbi:hypothetical protein BDV06DRAFT_138012 [Aspergillus oleicola]